jgi:hypothetical protein
MTSETASPRPPSVSLPGSLFFPKSDIGKLFQ